MGKRTHVVSAVCFFALVFAGAVEAQETERGFPVQNFLVAPGHGNYLTVEGASVPDDLRLRLGGMANYQYRPLLIRGCDRVEGDKCAEWADEKTPLVEHHLTLEVIGAFSLYRIFEVGLAVPVVLYQEGEDVPPADGYDGIDAPSSAAGMGDLRLHLKLDILHGLIGYEGDVFGLALVPVITFPVGNAVAGDSFMGDSSVTVHPKLAFDATVGRVRMGVNAGYMWREQQEFFLAEMGPRVSYGAGVEIMFNDAWSGVAEVFGQSGFTADLTSAPLEGDLAVRYRITPSLTFTGGGGAGILAGVGTPIFRLFAGLVWSPLIGTDRDEDGILDADDECPDEPEDKDDFEDINGCPDPDNDGDGLLDADDDCPDDPEDKDGHQDLDGCPELDNDGDGILDGDDECPDVAEDTDGFEDDDGCPDEDNDKDGIPDVDDTCPDNPEDKDEFEDADGCPDPDNDQDSILDKVDKCPNEKELFNGHEDEDGCPDEGEELLVVYEDQIRLLQKVHFEYDSDVIQKKSYGVLDVVVTVLQSNPELRVRIEGHTDSKGNRRYNIKLSQRRAEAVQRYLVEHGIEESRLEAKGYGPDKPIENNATREGRAANRRVEFHILK